MNERTPKGEEEEAHVRIASMKHIICVKNVMKHAI